MVPSVGEDDALWSLEDDGAAGSGPPRIPVGLPRTPEGPLHEKVEREFGVNADPPPRVYWHCCETTAANGGPRGPVSNTGSGFCCQVGR